jgi:PST family polysaccharide transporter
MIWTVLTSALNIVSFLIGVRWGAIGVAIAASLGFVIIQTPMIIWAATRLGPVTARFVFDAIAPIVVSLVITAPTVFLYSRAAHVNAVAKLCGGVLLTCTVYLLSLSLMPSGRRMLSETTAIMRGYVRRFRTDDEHAPA